MNNSLSMTADFERQKNIKALAITLGIAGALLLLFILLKWSLPTVPPVPTQEFLEVNLGTDDFGSGDDQPLLPGEPAPAQQRSEEHTSELQSPCNLVCRLLLVASAAALYSLSLHDALPICISYYPWYSWCFAVIIYIIKMEFAYCPSCAYPGISRSKPRHR